mmetsp:Transcript_27207/g.86442  ORF Transcript_27207/g.86442 Transcript_27207/m.86442 type:complete len:105 (+) Transcript_27207:62-376(+)
MAARPSALSQMSKWFLPQCGSKRPPVATPARKPKRNEEKVFIDRETEVPVELYMLMVEAGKSARARGQHCKVRPGSQSKPDAAGGCQVNRPRSVHLVRSAQGGA